MRFAGGWYSAGSKVLGRLVAETLAVALFATGELEAGCCVAGELGVLFFGEVAGCGGNGD